MCELCKHWQEPCEEMTLKKFQLGCLTTAGNATEKKWQYWIDMLKDYENKFIKDTFTNNGLEALREILEEQIYNDELNHRLLGIAGEAGEVAEKWKKVERNQQYVFAEDEDKEIDPKLITQQDIVNEIMDTMWYCVTALNMLDCDIEIEAERLLAKLKDRAERNVIKSAGDNR